jgi:hypothetical protein
MKRLLFALLAFLATAPSSLRADDIVVYRGTLRFSLDADSAALLTPVVQIYWVFNYTTADSGYIIYFNKAGKKRQTITSTVSIGTVPLPNAKQATLIAQGNANSPSPTDFTYSLVMLRGTNVALPVESGSSPRIISRPRVLVGDLVNVANGSNTFLQDGSVSLSVDKARTLSANDEGKTFDAVLTELEALLSSKGFQNL